MGDSHLDTLATFVVANPAVKLLGGSFSWMIRKMHALHSPADNVDIGNALEHTLIIELGTTVALVGAQGKDTKRGNV